MSQLEQNTTTIQSLINKANALPDAGSGEPNLQSKTVTPTISKQTVFPDSGYDGLDKVTVNAMPTATQATPSITVSSSGLITASATQSAGYVAAGTKSGTKQLTTQAAATVTPTTSNQTAVASGRYTTGAITVKGDANLKADNIKSGVSIFGIAGNYVGGGSSDNSNIRTHSVTFESNISNPISMYAYSCLDDSGNIAERYFHNPSQMTIDIVENTMLYVKISSEAIANGATIRYVDNDILPVATDSSSSLVFVNNDVSLSIYKPCFVNNTLIILADGTTKPVQDITYDDELLVWDFDNGCYSSARPIWIKKPEITPYYYRCEFANGTILKLVGSDGNCHRVFNVDTNTFEYANNSVGNVVMTQNGITNLLSCERIDEEVEFYNIITNRHLNLFAENVLTSCRLNNIYPIQDMKFVKDNRELIPMDKFIGIDEETYYGLRLGEQDANNIDELNEYIKNLYLKKV